MMTTIAFLVACFCCFSAGYLLSELQERLHQKAVRVAREDAIRKLWNGQIARWNEVNAERFRIDQRPQNSRRA